MSLAFRFRNKAAMDSLEPLKEPMYQALWRVKHEGKDAIAMEWSDTPAILFTYNCQSATEFEPVEEIKAEEVPAGRITIAWLFEMDRDTVKQVCQSVEPPAHTTNSDDWVNAVVGALFEKSLVFWKGDSEEELISFAALDPPSSRTSSPREKSDDADEITYESEEEYHVDFFLDESILNEMKDP